jgi:putative N6-adenine-specific DNA methylase
MDITNIPTATYHAKTLAGLEQLVADELLAHGATEIKIGRRGVGFTATAEVMYRHCMHARFTLKVLRILYQFQAKHTDELYRMAARKKWEDVLKADGTLTIDSTIYSDHFTHDQFAVLRLKDAIVDRFRAKKGERPSIDRQDPDVRIHLHISRQDVTISLDACGEPLSKRGYRSRKAIAPLNEVLAAGLLALSGWHPGLTLYDPMCGSGTFTCEAALWASGMPVQMIRSHFAFMEWMNFNRSAWIAVRDEAMDFNPPVPTTIYASDISGDAISQTKYALSQLDLPSHKVSVDEIDFFQSEPQKTEGGVVVINPPYGERMEPENIDEMYAAIGDRLKFHWSGFKAWIISSNPEAIKHIGLKSNHRHKVHNGPLECRWLGYELYAGSRFADKK